MRKSKQIFLFLLILTLTACSQPGINQSPTPAGDITVLVPISTTTPAPTPTPTSTPVELTNDGHLALLAGDYEAALEIFQKALSSGSDPQVVAASNLGIGQAYYEQDNYGPALDHLRLAASAEDPTIAGRAQYLLAQSFTSLERYDEALAAYDAYLQIRPGLLDSNIYTLKGDIYHLLGNYAQALANYQEAYRVDPAGGSESLAVEVAVAYENTSDQDTALAMYQNIYNTSDNGYTKAEMDLRIGRIYYAWEQWDQAYTYFQDAVNNYPAAYDAYTALVTLVNDGVPVDEFQRGVINYNVGNYALSVEAFDRFLATSPVENADAALYYKALATRAAGAGNGEDQTDEAIALWWQLIDNYRSSAYFIDAWEDIEYTQWAYQGEYQQAAETALLFVTRHSDENEAPAFLFLAGRSYERAGMLAEASATWQRIPNEYPSAAETFQAIYFAGIVTVRLGDWAAAQPLFSRALVLTADPAEMAAAYLWIGKCQNALGDVSKAVDTWKQAQLADPFGYYSIRAEDLLIQQDPFTDPVSYDLNPDLTPYRQEAEIWLRETFGLAADTNLESPGLLASDPRFQRGMEYWSLGLYEAGKAEFEALREAFANDPAQTFRLIPTLVDIGLYRTALVATTNLLKSAGLEGALALSAPDFFSRIRFGAYYLDWLLPEAAAEGFSPLLLLSVIRQESAYEGFIGSGAGAIGLMQLIPVTGAERATLLNWPEGYSTADLYRPYVSIVFGTNYLSHWHTYFEGDLYATLAAYNGGPGNAIAWESLAPDDPDLLLESIRVQETRNYIRLITEIQYIYGWLYGDPAER
ncbi:MAG: tetratricopeptide repeat protein [Anaerolineaceae bacterium]|nr:tetratricopeptide repeat protein [Anaerolineaceae bacterium]